MTQTERQEQLQAQIQRTVYLNNALFALQALDCERYPESYETLSTDAALRAERLACELRDFLFTATSIPMQDYMGKAAKAQGIEVSLQDGVFQVVLPRLLPKKRQKTSNQFLLEPLRAALEDFSASHDISHYGFCVICVEHIYQNSLSTWAVRDYDNLQLKPVLDLVSMHALTDDNGHYCDLYQTTGYAPQSCTRISIMEKERFSGWLGDRK